MALSFTNAVQVGNKPLIRKNIWLPLAAFYPFYLSDNNIVINVINPFRNADEFLTLRLAITPAKC